MGVTAALVSGLSGCGDDPVSSGGASAETGDADGGDDLPPEMNGVPTLEALGESVIRLTWVAGSDDVTAAEDLGYHVYRATTADGIDFTMAPSATLSGGTTTVDLSGLDPSQINYFVVRAVDELGQESDNTETVDGQTLDLTAPEFAGIELLEATDQGGVTATWMAATDNVSSSAEIVYDIYLGTDSQPQNDPANLAHTTLAGETTWTSVDPLEEVVEYYAVVRARDAADNADANVVARAATTLDVTAPTFGGVVSAQVFGGNIKLTWDAGDDSYNAPEELVYAIYAQAGPEVTDFSNPQITDSGVLEDLYETGQTDTEYSFVVRARDTAGNESDNTELATVTTASSLDGTPPTMSETYGATPASATRLDVVWLPGNDDPDTPVEQLRYGVWWSTTPNGHVFTDPPAVGPTEANATSTSITGLSPETIYYVVVRALDLANNWSENEASQAALTPADITPPDCSGLNLTATGQSSTTVFLEWDQATDDATTDPTALDYRVYQSDSAATVYDGAPIEIVDGTAGPKESTTVIGLQPEAPWYFGVRAVDLYNLSCDTVESAFGTALPDTSAPTFAGVNSATSIDETSVAIAWDPIIDDDVSGHADTTYTVYWGASGSVFSAPVGTQVAGTGVTADTVTGLTQNQQYFFGVRAADGYNNEDTNTAEASATTLADTEAPSVPAVNIATTSNTVTLSWPTPSTDNLTLAGAMVYEVCGGSCLGPSMSCVSDISTFTQNCEYYVSNPLPGVFAPAAPQQTAQGATSEMYSGFAQSTQVYYQVRACDEASNCSAWSLWLYGVTANDAVPPIEGVLDTANATTPSTMDLTWTQGSDETTPIAALKYRVFVVPTGQAFDVGVTPDIGPTAANILAGTVTGLTRDTTYDILVQSQDSAGNWSVNTTSQGSATTPSDTTPPGASPVTDVVETSCTTMDVTFSTTTDDGIFPEDIVYSICASLAADGCNDANFATNVVATVTDLDAALTSHTETVDVGSPGSWNVRVRAADDVPNLNAELTELSVSLQDTEPPQFSAPPLGTDPVTVTPNWGAGWAASLTMDWTASAATDACSDDSTITYEVCVFDVGVVDCATTFNAVAAASTATTLTVLDPEIESNTAEILFVRAIDENGNVSASQAAQSTTTGVSFDADVRPLFEDLDNTQGGCKSTATCHSNVNAELMASGGNWTYDNTVNTTFTAKCPTVEVWDYVVPGDPESSLLWVHTQPNLAPPDGTLHPDGCTFGQMPYNGSYVPAYQQTLYDWINQGAFNN